MKYFQRVKHSPDSEFDCTIVIAYEDFQRLNVILHKLGFEFEMNVRRRKNHIGTELAYIRCHDSMSKFVQTWG